MRSIHPFILAEAINMEMETVYPYLVVIKNQLHHAISERQPAKAKYYAYQALRKTESYLSAEVSKLKNKPKRATKYTAYMKKLISNLKMTLHWLPEHDELIAFPTLALIMTHFLDIVLTTSMRDKFPSKCIASNVYGFIKMIFDADLEYVLDVVLCSNVAEDAAADPKSVGFAIMENVLNDHYLYTRYCTTPMFVKYMTVASLLKDCPTGDKHVAKALKDLTEHPIDLQEHLIKEYGFPRNVRFSINSVLANINTRRVVAVNRQKRLVIVSCRPRRATVEIENEENEIASTSGGITGSQQRNTEDPLESQNSLFYIDVKGLYGNNNDGMDTEITSTFPTIDVSDSENNNNSDNEAERSYESEPERSISDNESEPDSSAHMAGGEDNSESDAEESDDVVPLEDNYDTQPSTSGLPQRHFEEMFDRRSQNRPTPSLLNRIDLKSAYTPADSDDSDVEDITDDHEDKDDNVEEVFSDRDEAADNDMDEEENDQSENEELLDPDDIGTEEVKPKADTKQPVKKNEKQEDEKSDVTTTLTKSNLKNPILSLQKLKPTEVKAASKRESSDDDLEVLFVDQAAPITNSESEEERDLADPESGEDEVPEYGPEDYVPRQEVIEKNEEVKEPEKVIEPPTTTKTRTKKVAAKRKSSTPPPPKKSESPPPAKILRTTRSRAASTATITTTKTRKSKKVDAEPIVEVPSTKTTRAGRQTKTTKANKVVATPKKNELKKVEEPTPTSGVKRPRTRSQMTTDKVVTRAKRQTAKK